MAERNEITKIDAAERQLAAAVRMFFDCADPVPIYTLAAASREVLSTILSKVRQASSLDLISGATGRSPQEVCRELHQFARFFKHADSDPEGKLSGFEEKHVEVVLFAACHDFQELAGGGPVEVQAFELWWLAANETRPASEPGIVEDIRGRAATARAKAAPVQALNKAEGVGPSEIARRLGIGRSSVYRLLGSAA